MNTEHEESVENQNKPKNRKRKKSFLQNAKKYGKKGTYGRGSHLTEDTYQYFVNVLELFKNDFETKEEKEIFINNVLEQTVGEEVNYSRNQVGCRVIEMLLPFANDDVLKRYFQAFNDDLRPLLSDRFASHVIQMLVKIAAHKSVNGSTNNIDEEHIAKHSFNFASKISKFLLNNLEDFVWDTYANHIIRTALLSLSGIFEEKGKNGVLKDRDKSELLDDYVEIVKEYAERLMKWPQFIDLPYEELTSGLLQVLVSCLRKIDSKLMKQMVKKLLEESFLGDEYKNGILDVEQKYSSDSMFEKKLPPVFEREPAIHLLEVAIVTVKSKMYTQIYEKCFKNNLVELAKLKKTNFTIQKLLSHCTNKAEFELIYDELAPEMENIFLSGHPGVIVNLAQASKTLGTRQGQFLQQLMKMLHCSESVEKENLLVPLILRMVPYERFQKLPPNFPISLHGSVIIQSLLGFNKPIKVINSILSMDSNDLKSMFCNVKGCHVMDSFMTSTYVGEKSREKLIRRLQGTYQELAANKYGSRSFDALWKVTNIKQKFHIMDELSHKEAGWSNTEFGKIIASKTNILLYKRNKDQWQTSLNKSDKTKELFADIIGNVTKNSTSE